MRWQAVQPSPAPVCWRTSLTVRNESADTASSSTSSVTCRQWQTTRPGQVLQSDERAGQEFAGVSGEMKTLIPKKCMDELKSLVDSTDVETIEFAKDESTLFFRIGPRLLTSRQLTGQFPN